MESRNLPNATLIVVLGALSIVSCCLLNVVGLTIGLVALYLAMKAEKIYKADPHAYDNYSTVNIGKILAIIGIVINVISLLATIWVIATFGWEVLGDTELLQENIREYFGQ